MEETEEQVKRGYDLPWLINCGLITAVAAFLRFFDLGLKPFHHDEGVNGFFLTSLFRNGTYSYDPANYHGPTLYYISLFFSKLFGLNTISVRASVAIFGVLTVVLAFYLRPFIGKIGALAAAAFIALSPGMVFISRYFIHEIFFVFLALGFVLALLLFVRNERAGPGAIAWMAVLLLVCFAPSGLMLARYFGDSTQAMWTFAIGILLVQGTLIVLVIRMLISWNGGRPIYMLLASASVSLMFATKETAFITLGTMAIAVPCLIIWQKVYGARTEVDELSAADTAISWKNFRLAAGEGSDRMLLIGASAIVFVYVFVLFFSSFFTFPDGIWRAFEAYSFWSKTGTKDHTQSGFWGYLKWGMPVEGPILILSMIGTLLAFFRGLHRVAMFIALWGVGLFLAYSLIPYKTPWLALSFLLPMSIAAGYGIGELVRSANLPQRIVGLVLGAAGCMVLAYQAFDLNFVNYDNNDRTYVYAHTRRDFLEMMSKIDHYARKSGKGREFVIDVVSPDYWPMVWYTNDYPKAVYHGRMFDNPTGDVIVAKKTDQDREVIGRLAGRYKLEGVYPLRPGVDLVLIVRSELADPTAQDLSRLRNY